LYSARESVALNAASLGDPPVRGPDQILLPPCRRVKGDRLSIFFNDLAQPDTEETGFRPAHDDDPGRTMLIEQPGAA
jgi:hypothetical protein